jgi:hypothetical protein
MRLVCATALVAAMGASAHADPHEWIDDTVETVLEAPMAGGHLSVEKRSMIYQSGYLYVALTAEYRPAHGIARRTLLAEGPTMCDEVKRVGASLVVEICTERFADTREVTPWRLDRATGRFIAGRPHQRSPYAEQARKLVIDLRDGRTGTLAAIDRLGDSPDGQASITWWWDAQRFIADWPAISHAASPAAARRLVEPHMKHLLFLDDNGDPALRAALDADLRVVPRCNGSRVGGPRRLEPYVTRAIALLRAGDADERALADAAIAATR